jgi:hypothetical protein
MKKLAFLFVLIAAVFVQNTPVFAQGEAAVPFLLIAPGARSGGMGEGGVALVKDATAIFWNPAGLAYQYDNPENARHGQVTFMHSKWLPQFNFSDLFYDYMAASYDFGEIGTLGASITYLNLGKNVWTDETGAELGTFDSFEYALSVAYATKLYDNVGIGLNAKIVQSNLSNVNPGTEDRDGRATTFAVDLGMLWTPEYDFLNNRLSLGFNLSNFGPKVTYIDRDQADPMPTNLRLGMAVNAYDDGFNKITVIYDLNRLLVKKYKDGTSDDVFTAVFYSSWVKGSASERIGRFTQSFGLEYRYGSLIAIRGGYFYEDPRYGARKFMTVGAGIGYSIFDIDFSYISAAEDHPLSDTMRFSLGVSF